MSKIVESLYLKVLINIVVQSEKTLVHIELCSKKGIVNEISTEFNTIVLNNKMYDFIDEYIKESPYYYVNILDTSLVQGALPVCEKERLAEYFDLSMSEYKCIDDTWTVYTDKNELHELQRTYEEIGLDMVFSPFVLLSKFFKDKIDGHLAMYVLVQEAAISVMIFENSQLLYAQHLDILIGDEAEDILLNDDIEENLDLELDDGIELENINVNDDVDSLDEFGDIEDLDALEDIDEFAEGKDVEEELQQIDEELPEDEDNEAFNEDYQRFTLIQSAVAHYYKDNRYDSRFIENIYIADAVGVTNDLKKYLEEEMYFNVYVRQIDLTIEVAELAKMELGL